MLTNYGRFGANITVPPKTKAQRIALVCVVVIQVAVIAFCIYGVFALYGCCACPPPWGEADDLATDVVAWPTDSISTAELWASADSVMVWTGLPDTMPTLWDVWVADQTLPRIDEPTTVDPYGPWPCRWVHWTREECCEDVAPIRHYEVIDGEVVWSWEYVPAVAITRTVKDSVWHCDGDGTFTR